MKITWHFPREPIKCAPAGRRYKKPWLFHGNASCRFIAGVILNALQDSENKRATPGDVKGCMGKPSMLASFRQNIDEFLR